MSAKARAICRAFSHTRACQWCGWCWSTIAVTLVLLGIWAGWACLLYYVADIEVAGSILIGMVITMATVLGLTVGVFIIILAIVGCAAFCEWTYDVWTTSIQEAVREADNFKTMPDDGNAEGPASSV
jgi:hypothetical protein